MRICSLLPSATEIVYAIGLGDSIFGVSHECDFPPGAATKPSLLCPRVDPRAPPAEIDRQVSEIIARGESIYAVDAELLQSRKLPPRPDHDRAYCAWSGSIRTTSEASGCRKWFR